MLEASMPPPDGESHSRPFAQFGAAFSAIELIENHGQVLGVDSGAIVFHAEFKAFVRAFAAQRDARAGRRVAGYVLK
jgi:hypothetical protein